MNTYGMNGSRGRRKRLSANRAARFNRARAAGVNIHDARALKAFDEKERSEMLADMADRTRESVTGVTDSPKAAE